MYRFSVLEGLFRMHLDQEPIHSGYLFDGEGLWGKGERRGDTHRLGVVWKGGSRDMVISATDVAHSSKYGVLSLCSRNDS